MANAREWAKRVAEWRASGETAEEFAAGKGYAGTTLRWWSSRLGREVDGGQRRPEVRLARVVREAPTAPTAPSGEIVIELGGACVRVPMGVDLGTLRTVLAALGGEA